MSSTSSITVDDLRSVSLFAGEPAEQLEWLAERMVEQRFGPGEIAYHQGDEATHMVIVLQGTVQLLRTSAGVRRLFDVVGPGRATGLLPYSRMTHYGGDAAIVESARLALLDKVHFADMVHRMPAVGQTLVGILADRVRSATRGDQQREKMIALGKLSAGLAHELNNPSAAVQRSAGALRDRLHDMNRLVGRLVDGGGAAAEWVVAETLRRKGLAFAPQAPLGALDRSEREEALVEWFVERDLEDDGSYAEVLSEAGLSPNDLDAAMVGLEASAVSRVVGWTAATLDAERLLQEIEAASSRIAHLVASVKAYSHMDRAPEMQLTDVREGIETTLTMLGHRLKEKSIEVVREYARELPSVEAHPGELNQVWTNLIDNAIDAVGEGGTIRVGARSEGAMLAIWVTDNGSGIPPDVRPRIFEPFFSTKDVGAGTGLGLEVVDRIVRQHGGDIKVDSVRGNTTFRVLLPL